MDGHSWFEPLWHDGFTRSHDLKNSATSQGKQQRVVVFSLFCIFSTPPQPYHFHTAP